MYFRYSLIIAGIYCIYSVYSIAKTGNATTLPTANTTKLNGVSSVPKPTPRPTKPAVSLAPPIMPPPIPGLGGQLAGKQYTAVLFAPLPTHNYINCFILVH